MSGKAIGLVEPLVVITHPTIAGQFSILDGHLRVEALTDLGVERARCIIVKDDEAYTYNKRVNRLAVIQEHRMIVLAAERGVSAERLGAALGISAAAIRSRFKMLDGICGEAVAILAEKQVPRSVFPILWQMQAFRQIDVAQAMVSLGNFSTKLALAMLETTAPDQLQAGTKRTGVKSEAADVIQRLERELAALQTDTRLLEDNYGPDNLKLVVVKTYIANLLNNARVVRWLAQFHADYLQRLQRIAEIKDIPGADARMG
ncbi:chromosome partitioning protein ParB [Pandoraea terrae]|uniref:Chromosome partitioning protein ParB n=1 Tax=Pandoraea terrae TaxID=1537710 RepID=A0A5E4UD25_9BURK|nr:plasmid partitioning protein RepB C-terminal domain-containing protein [Pandoraea terrae]VVD96734.1 chromosome partitioning protein ParB [Pandoraea terrae]